MHEQDVEEPVDCAALSACAAAVTALLQDAGPGMVPVRVIGAGLTLASVATTILFNVPWNNALA